MMEGSLGKVSLQSFGTGNVYVVGAHSVNCSMNGTGILHVDHGSAGRFDFIPIFCL